MRNNYGKGVAYGEVDGRRVIFYTSPAFFLHALDAKTGEHLENWGTRCRFAGFSGERRRRHAARPGQGLGAVADLRLQVRPRITASRAISATSRPRRRRSSSTAWSSSATSTSRATTRRASRTSPATSSAYDAAHRQAAVEVPRHPAAGRVRPRHVEERRVEAHRRRLVVGADVGRSRRAGSSTSPPTRRRSTSSAASGPATTCSAPASSRSTSRPASARWHFQMVHHDIWNFDNPHRAGAAGRADRRPADADRGRDHQAGLRLRRSIARPASRSGRSKSARSPHRICPARCCRRRSRFPTKPKPLEIQELTEDNLIDFTPELRAGGARDHQELQDRPALQPADPGRAIPPACARS